MRNSKKNKTKDFVDNLLNNKHSSNQALIEAFIELKPSKSNWVAYFFFFVLSVIIAVIISSSENTVLYMINTADIFNTLTIAIFAVVFSGYVFFQALVSGPTLKRFLDEAKPGETQLQRSNEYFLNMMMLYIVSIVINAALLIILKCLPVDLVLPGPQKISEYISFIFIFLYVIYNFLIVFEIKSFVFNIFQMFNIHALEEIAEYEESKKGK